MWLVFEKEKALSYGIVPFTMEWIPDIFMLIFTECGELHFKVLQVEAWLIALNEPPFFTRCVCGFGLLLAALSP